MILDRPDDPRRGDDHLDVPAARRLAAAQHDPRPDLVYVAAVLPFTIWTLRGFVAGVPVELEEAAMIDGCSRTAGVLRGSRSR